MGQWESGKGSGGVMEGSWGVVRGEWWREWGLVKDGWECME